MSRKDETPIVTEEVKSDGFEILTLSIILCKHSSKSKHRINEQALKAVSKSQFIPVWKKSKKISMWNFKLKIFIWNDFIHRNPKRDQK